MQKQKNQKKKKIKLSDIILSTSFFPPSHYFLLTHSVLICCCPLTCDTMSRVSRRLKGRRRGWGRVTCVSCRWSCMSHIKYGTGVFTAQYATVSTYGWPSHSISTLNLSTHVLPPPPSPSSYFFGVIVIFVSRRRRYLSFSSERSNFKTKIQFYLFQPFFNQLFNNHFFWTKAGVSSCV